MFLLIVLGVSKWMKWQNTVADPGEGPGNPGPPFSKGLNDRL